MILFLFETLFVNFDRVSWSTQGEMIMYQFYACPGVVCSQVYDIFEDKVLSEPYLLRSQNNMVRFVYTRGKR